jgi:pyruvate dehydrogenase E2 component (dihydrolipoamide acetyltransferase)
MPIEVKMPALSPTMEEGTLAKWLIKEGDFVKAGDLIAEIETDKATMDLEAVEEGRVARILAEEGTEAVRVGAVIALMTAVDEDVEAEPLPAPASITAVAPPMKEEARPASPSHGRASHTENLKISPLAARIAKAQRIDLSGVTGSGTGGCIVRADLGLSSVPAPAPQLQQTAPMSRPAITAYGIPDVPHEIAKLSTMRKTIARRLIESKQQVPHIYLTVDVVLDPLLKLRAELNDALAPRGVKLSVNDMIIKALGPMRWLPMESGACATCCSWSRTRSAWRWR